MDAEPPRRPAELNEGQPEKQGEDPTPATAVLSKIRKMVSERLKLHRSWRGFTNASPAGKK